MAGNLHFDVDATNSASGEFAAVAAELEALARKLKDLDGKSARVKAEVAVAGAAALEKLDAQLKALPNRTTTHVNVDVDRDAAARLSGLTQQALRLAATAGVAVVGISKLRAAAKNIIDPESPSLLRRASEAFGVMHKAAELAAPVIDRMRGGLVGLNRGLLVLGAAGSAVKVVAAATTSLVQLSGAALLLPAVMLGGAAAVGTLKAAFAGFGDAVNAKDAKAFAEATKDMAPAARATAVAVRQLKTEFVSVQQAVQGRLFAGMADQVRALGATYLPVLRVGLAGVAGQFNGMGTAAAIALRSVSNIAAVRTIIGNTDTALGRMRSTLANVLTGFLTLGGAGSAWLPRLAAAIDSAAAKFAAWSARITSDGTFNRWVGNAVAAFVQLGQLLRNIASIAGTVFGALNTGGVGLFGTLVGLTAQLRAFLQSAQGASALRALAQTLQVAGDAAQRVFGAALRQLGPILSAIAPLVQAFAVAISGNLVTILNVVGPLLQRFAAELAQHPQLLVAVAHAAALVTIGFAPMAAVISLVATTLKALLIAQLVGKGLELLGLQGSVAGRVLQALVSPLRLIGELGPLVARGVGLLAAQLGIMAGPIGVLVVLFATLYASSSQFRDAANSLAGVIGGLLLQTLQQAAQVLKSTVDMLAQFGAAAGSALSGVADLGSKIASVFGPAGKVVEDVLTGIFNSLGNLPGAALAAYAAFVVLGKIAPLLTAASAAVAGFSARMLAVQSSSAIASAAANGAGRAAGALSTALSKAGAALPVIGVALVALGAVYDQIRSRADEFAQSVVQGSMSMSQAIQQQEAIYNSGFSGIANAVLGGTEGMLRWTDANYNAAKSSQEVRAAIEAHVSALPPLEQAQARVQISQQNLNNMRLSGTATAQQLADAEAVLARDKADLAAKEKTLADASRTATQAMREQTEAAQTALGAQLALSDALRRVTDAQTAANDAARQHGATSKEAAAAADEYVRSADQAAQAAQRKAEADAKAAGATNAADVGTRAYGATLLQLAANADGPARQALLGYIGNLTDAERQALSAGAEASGFATKVLQLPNGKTVKVAIDPETGKIISTQQLLDALRDKTVTINGNAVPLQNALQTVLGQVNQAGGTVTINGNTVPAGQALQTIVAAIAAGQASVTINGQTMPTQVALSTVLQQINASGATTTINGTTVPAGQALAALLAEVNGSKATSTIDGDNNPGRAALAALVSAVLGQHPNMPVGANDGPARSTVAGTVQWIKNQNPTLTVTVQYSGSSPAAVHAAGYARGGVVGYAKGGIVDYSTGRGLGPVRAASGLVLGGYRPGRDTVPAMLSPGEGVAVPQLVREMGAGRFLAANSAALAGRSGLDVLAGRGPDRVGAVMGQRGGAGGSGAAAAAAWQAMSGELAQLRGEYRAQTDRLAKVVSSARGITVEDRSGNPVETARATSLALRFA